MASGIFIPSQTSISEALRLSTMSTEQIVKEYLSHPPLPYNETIRIDKIEVLNFDSLNREPLGTIQYKLFRAARPDLFPLCVDPKLDYEDHDQVTPAIILSGDKKFRIDQKLWFPISDIVADITTKQGRLGGIKLLPIEVFIDDRNQWLVPLFNLGGSKSGNRRR